VEAHEVEGFCIIGLFVHVFHSEEIRTNQVDDGSRYSILQDGTLMIENAQDSDEGVYECVARNQLGEVKAEAVSLRYLDDKRPSACLQHCCHAHFVPCKAIFLFVIGRNITTEKDVGNLVVLSIIHS